MEIFLPILIIVVVIVVAIIRNAKDPYNKENQKIIEEKGEIKLSTEILLILSEEGYRPELEKRGESDSNSETITVKIDGDNIGILFYDNQPNCFQIVYHSYAFEAKERNEVLERVNKINCETRFAYMSIYDDDVYSVSDVYIDDIKNAKNILFRSLQAVIFVKNEYWELQNQKYSLN